MIKGLTSFFFKYNISNVFLLLFLIIILSNSFATSSNLSSKNNKKIFELIGKSNLYNNLAVKFESHHKLDKSFLDKIYYPKNKKLNTLQNNKLSKLIKK